VRLLVLSCAFAVAGLQASISVLSHNVQNLFDVAEQYGEWLSAVLRTVHPGGADIIALHYVWRIALPPVTCATWRR